MIALVIAALAAVGLFLLARLEGSLPADEEPPNGGSAADTGAVFSRASLQYEILRFATAIAAFIAGAMLATAVFDVAGSRAALVPTAVVAGVVTALVLTAVQRAAAESAGGRTAHALPSDRALAPLGTIVRRVSTLGRSLASLGNERDDERDEAEASEQFSQVISSEVEMSKDEEKLLRGAISLPRTSVHEVMVPRVAIVGIDVDTPWSEMLDRVKSAEHSRLPVFRDSLDDIVGVLVVKDLLPFALSETPPDAGWQQLVRPATFVPSTKGVDDQLRDFRQSRAHMAVVVDEFGGTAGILTLEDVLEELVGEIRDEHDVEEAPVTADEGNRYWVSGRLPVDDLESLLGEELFSRHASTVGGLVLERLGRVPRLGEELTWGSYRVVVDRMKRRTVDRVYFERMNGGGDVE